MNQILLIIFFLTNFVKSEEYYVRVSIIPEYEQNFVTVLMSYDRLSEVSTNVLSFTVPNKTDSVYIIDRSMNKQLGFTSVNYYKKDGYKWVDISNIEKQNAFMIITNKYEIKGERDFNYQLLFSEKIKQIDIELQEPLAAENFNYSGFKGEKLTNKGQNSYKKTLFDFPKYQSLDLFFEYINDSGNTTKTELNKTSIFSENNKQKSSKNRQKINRYKLYTLETHLALFIITSLIVSIILFLNNRESISKCKKCNYDVKVNDLFCSKCGEKR
tara:strand:+ start:1584 stop:2396 length:813 start_codon:yes stop_codon:yes gene_type:complete